ncbi:acyl-CoA dehydrogenase family protein [Nocardia pseudovaccinii]|uniref:acyl-CoA dehydrogenase family protein n=1 Tax=Nocardia pseudovaccinii TaxID=189540 RepID=UPI003D89C1DC
MTALDIPPAKIQKETLLQAARDIVPLLRENAPRVDAEARIPDENLNALRDANLLAVLRPRRYGGVEVGLSTSLKLQAILAEGCGSTSWVVGLGSVSSYLVAQFSQEAQDDVWGTDPDARISVANSPAEGKLDEVTEEGWVISGRWRYASGSRHAQWIVVGVPASDAEGNPDVGLALVPMSEVEIENNWHVAGMRGTASDTIVANRVFVPAHRQSSLNAAIAGETRGPYANEPGTIYRAPFFPVFYSCLAASPVGLARAALAIATEVAPTRRIPYSGILQSDDQSIQILIANAAIAADSAEMHLLRMADETDRATAEDRTFTAFETQRALSDCVAAARYSVEAVRNVTRALMSSSFFDSNPLQRIWRDSEMAGSHLGFAEFNVAPYAKEMFNVSG